MDRDNWKEIWDILRVTGIIVLIFLCGALYSTHCFRAGDDVVDSVRTVVVDTAVYVAPTAKDSVEVGIVVATLPVYDRAGQSTPSPVNNPSGKKRLPLSQPPRPMGTPPIFFRKQGESIAGVKNRSNRVDELNVAPNDDLKDELNRSDSVEVVVPITQRVYADSVYRAYVSGYRACLDSIVVYPRREVITVYKRDKVNRWGVGVHVGYGMTIEGRPRLSPYIGVGVSYNFLSF